MMTLRRPPRRGFGEQPATLAAIQNLFARGELGGYWPADPQYAYEDSAGTTLASVDGVVGLLINAVTGYPNAIQATTANKPYLRRTPATGKYWYDSNTATGALTATFASALGRRNLLTYTEDFSNAVWVLNTGSVVIAQNSVVSPDGLTSGIKVTETTTTGEQFFEQLIAVNTNQSYSSSIYVKAGNTTGFSICVVAVGSSDELSYASFTIAAGVISVGSNNGIITSSSATLIGDGWYRFLVIYTLNGTVTSHRQRIHPKNTGVYTGDGVSYLYIWHPQLETGTTPTDYQKIVAGPSAVLDPVALTTTYPQNISATTNCTIACVTPEGVVIADNQTVGTTYNITPPFGYNSDVLVINRALTPAEKALVTRVMQRSVPTLGSELMTNGGFDVDASGWTSDNGSTLTVSNYQLTSTNAAARPSAISPILGIKTDVFYKVAFTVIAYISYLNYRLRDSAGANGSITGTGVKNITLKADTNNQSLWFYSNSANQNFTLKEISVKAIL